MSTRILFIRHGQSDANKENYWAGNIDVKLTKLGEEQAEKAAKFVISKYNVDGVYSSTLQRAKCTAEKISNSLGIDVITDERLCEINGGDWQGLKFEEIKENYPKEFKLWKEDMSSVYPPNGESVFDVQKRGFNVIKEICEANDGKTIVIVSHRVILRTIQCLWENIPLEEINKCQWIDNCAVSEVEYKNGALNPISINQSDFMGELNTKLESIM